MSVSPTVLLAATSENYTQVSGGFAIVAGQTESETYAVQHYVGAAVAVGSTSSATYSGDSGFIPTAVTLVLPPVSILNLPASMTVGEPVTVTFLFPDAVVGFTETDISVTNGTLTDFTTVNGSTYTARISPTSSGTLRITVGEVSQDVPVKVNQSITFEQPTAQTYAPNGTFTVAASSNSDLLVSFTSTSTDVCTVAGSRVTILNAGNCILSATQAGNGIYNPAAAVQRTVTINKAVQTLTFAQPAVQAFQPNGTFSVSASSSANLTVAFASDTASVCTVSGNTVTIHAIGTCRLTASQAGDGNYNAATDISRDVVIRNSLGIPSISATSPVTLAATGTVSAYSLTTLGVAAADNGVSMTPVAYYRDGACADTVPANYATACRRVAPSGFTSGQHRLWWVVQDSDGNRNQTAQTLNVLPQVGFAKDLILIGTPGSGMVQVALVLSGEAVGNTAFSVPFTLSGTASHPTDHNLVAGNFTFAAGQTVSDPVAVTLGNAPVDGNTLVITLNTQAAVFNQTGAAIDPAVQRVTAGSKTTQTITISQQRTYPPRLSNLRGSQGTAPNTVSGSTFDKIKGTVQLSFGLEDLDGGRYSYSWVTSNPQLLLANGSPLTSATDASPTLDIANLNAGSYYLEVAVTDSTAPTSLPAKIEVMLQVLDATTLSPTQDSDSDGNADATEGLGDNDGDGIANYRDAYDDQANVLPTDSTIPRDALVRTRPGLRIRIGTTAIAAATNDAKVTLDDLTQHGDRGQPASNATFTNATMAHLFDYEIENLDVPADTAGAGNTADVVLPLSTPLAADSQFFKYDAVNGWRVFTEDANNRLAWASWLDGVAGNCPEANSTAYTADTAQKAGKTCLRVTLQDGGANDADGVVNGRIVDPLGVGASVPIVIDPPAPPPVIDPPAPPPVIDPPAPPPVIDPPAPPPVIDPPRPTVSIMGLPSSVTTGRTYRVTFQFSEDVIGFEASDINLINGTLSRFIRVDDNTYTARITSTNKDTLTISIPSRSLHNHSGNSPITTTLNVVTDGHLYISDIKAIGQEVAPPDMASKAVKAAGINNIAIDDTFVSLAKRECLPHKEGIAALYVAFFNRAPDTGGLHYWAVESGLTLEQVADSFFYQAETQAAYPPGTTNTEFVTRVYRNLFGREPDPTGLAYWTSELDSGRIYRNLSILAFINGAQGADKRLLDNKTAVGCYFADQDLVEQEGLAHQVMQGVTADANSFANTKALIDIFVRR